MILRGTGWVLGVASLCLTLLMPLAAPSAAGARIPTQNEVESSLTCQCGCGLTVHSCDHLNCGSGIPLKKEIGERIAESRTLPQILSYFEQKYGEKILAAPTKRGFNLAAWIVPFVVIGLGGIMIAFALRRWRVQPTLAGIPGQEADMPTETISPEQAALRARLERELRDRDA